MSRVPTRTQMMGALASAVFHPRSGDILLVGDSHAISNSGAVLGPGPRLRRGVAAGKGRRVWGLHLGPRLMYSLARDGLPPGLRLPQAVDHVVLVAGEIDIRTRPIDLDASTCAKIAAGIALRVTPQLAAMSRASRVSVAIPVPPSAGTTRDGPYPSAGTIEDRIHAHRRLANALHAMARQGPPVIDMTSTISGASGELLQELSSDSCHLNLKGAQIWLSGLNG